MSRFVHCLITSLVISGTSLGYLILLKPVQASMGAYCQFDNEDVINKERLLKASLEGDAQAKEEYKLVIQEDGDLLNQCRRNTWPQEQAIWLRLYPCDVSPGSLDYVLDRIVNLGYNKVHLEVFYDSQVLLPPADNPTPWIPVVRSPGAENVDLLQQAIEKGHERGLRVYAWLFTLNFGYTYAQLSDRQDVLARNGRGENSLKVVHDNAQAFIDPYNRQAQIDYYNLVQEVLQRQPDGVLFDYVRYAQGKGTQLSVNQVQDLWIYSPASLEVLYNRAKNQKARALMERYLTKGTLSASDIVTVDNLYPKEGAPDWQGRQISTAETKQSASVRQNRLQSELWYFTVAHAAQGVIDFLSFASSPVQKLGLPAGAVFFPEGNRLMGKGGFDSRLQAWDKFPASLEWHPMSYAICEDGSCVINQVKKVLDSAPSTTKVTPAIAGVWGKTYNQHPSLEVQMNALHAAFPEINSVSHFSYSWIEPEIDRQRKFCHLQ
jgi:hypothetical protein